MQCCISHCLDLPLYLLRHSFVIADFLITASAYYYAAQTISSSARDVPRSWSFTTRSGLRTLVVERSRHSCLASLLIVL